MMSFGFASRRRKENALGLLSEGPAETWQRVSSIHVVS
jgi:hypothetical protein